MSLCNGGCGNEALYGNWCSVTYNLCPGYKKKLSDKAKLRGNNGSKGSLSKKYTEDDNITQEYELSCHQCQKPFKRKLKRITFLRFKKFLCVECVRSKVSNTLIENHKKKMEITPYHLKSSKERKISKCLLQDKKCNKCGYNLYDIYTGPYELHHIDGNCNNITLENEEVLCCNCHAMTDNYRFKGQSHNSETKAKKFGGLYKLYDNY